jgi:hypothetical protein
MRHLKLMAMLVLASLFVGLLAPTAVAQERTRFEGAYFPAGAPGTDTECPGTISDLGLCILEEGVTTVLPNGRVRIKGMQALSIAFSFTTDGDPEPRKTGTDHLTVTAVLDETASGPAWGRWVFRDADGNAMFSGHFIAWFDHGVPSAYFIGKGVGEYRGERMRGRIDPAPNADGFNMFGTVVSPG